jgi:hypothetical protein
MQWNYKASFPITDITVDSKVLEQIRISGTNPEIVDQYRIAMERGDDFPAIVLLQQKAKGKGNETFLIVTGHHRFEAATRATGVSRLDAYIIYSPLTPTALEDLAWDINMLEQSDGYTREQRIHRGYLYHKKRGYTLVDAAARVMVTPDSIAQYKIIIDVKDKLLRLSVNPKIIDKLSQHRLQRLHGIVTSKFLPEVAKMATGLQDRQLQTLVTGLRKAPSDVERSQMIKEAKKDLVPVGKVGYLGPRQTPAGTLFRLVKSARTVVNKALQEDTEIPDDDKPEFVKAIKDLRRDLSVLEKALH